MKTKQKTGKKKYSKRLNQKNQVTIPMYFIKKLNFGKNVSIEENGEGIIIKKEENPNDALYGCFSGEEKNPIFALRGIAKGPGKTSLELKKEIRQEEKKREKRKFGISSS